MSVSLSARLSAGEALLSGWVGLPDSHVAEAVSRAGFDAVTLDMQHGLVDLAVAFRQAAAVRHAGGRTLVRIPVGDFATASRLLDAGVDGVIAPMIESVEDARAFAAFMKYPPLGRRSFGPGRALQLDAYDGAGEDLDAFRVRANRECLAIVMIETRRALDAVEDILALPEVDGVFVGPSDLSIALSDGARVDVDAPENVAALERVARAAGVAGKPAAAFAVTGGHARRYFAMGYRLITLMTELHYLSVGARALIAEARG